MIVSALRSLLIAAGMAAIALQAVEIFGVSPPARQPSPWTPLTIHLSKADAASVAHGCCVEIGRTKVCGNTNGAPTQIVRMWEGME